MERRLEERAHEYDRALRESQSAAVVRRTTVKKTSGDNLEMSKTGHPVVTKLTPPILDSIVPPSTMEESNVNPFPHTNDDIQPEDVERDGDVRSELGDSYVDGKVPRGRTSQPSTLSVQREGGTTSIEDGGMLNLLTQIYGTKGPGHKRVL